MNHDPLCPRQPYEHVIEKVFYFRGTEPDLSKIGTTVTMWTADEDACLCDLIAKVREATLREAIAAVAPITVDFGGMPQAEKVMSALRGLLGEQQ